MLKQDKKACSTFYYEHEEPTMTNNLALLQEIEKRCGGLAPDAANYAEEWHLLPHVEDEEHIEMLLRLYFGDKITKDDDGDLFYSDSSHQFLNKGYIMLHFGEEGGPTQINMTILSNILQPRGE
jgi:hypothetical protein